MNLQELEQVIVRHPDEVAKEYRAAGVWRATTIDQDFDSQAARNPAQEAVISAGERITYGELRSLANQLAASLAERGAAVGDRAVFQLGNVVETAIAYFGCLKAGVIPVCSLPLHGEAEMDYLIEASKARFHFIQADYKSGILAGLASQMRSKHECLEAVVVVRGRDPSLGLTFDEMVSRDGIEESGAVVDAQSRSAESVAVLQLSGGTTAMPKLIPRFHMEYSYNSRAYGEFYDWSSETTVLHCLPVIHNAGIVVGLQGALLSGARFVMTPSADAATVLDAVERERVTDIPAALLPVMPVRLLREPNANQRMRSVQRFVLAGDRLSPELADRIESELQKPILQNFGMGEGLVMGSRLSDSPWVRRNTVGRPISPLDEVRILEPGSNVEVEQGQVGELCCRGPYTIRGYFASPERNREAFTPDGLYRSGDLARAHVTDGGLFYSIEGRIKDLVNRGGEKINAGEIETLVVSHPMVEAAALIGMPDPELGERPCCYVVLDVSAGKAGEQLTLDELNSHLRQHGIAKYKLPERLEIVDELPRTKVGKVSKKLLREDITRKLARQRD